MDFIYTSSEYSTELLSTFRSLRQKGILLDAEISCGTNIFRAHKLLLCSASPYFLAMLGSTNSSQLDLSHLDPDATSALIDYIYSGELTVGNENITNVLVAADCLGLRKLKEATVKHIISGVSPENCVEILNLAQKLELDELAEAAERVASQELTKVARSPEFRELSPSQLGRIVRKVSQTSKHSDPVVAALLSWLPDETNLIDRKSEEIKVKTVEVIVLAGGATGDTNFSSNVFCFAPNSHRWGTLATLPFRVRSLRSAVADNVFYLAGGFTETADTCVYNRSVVAYRTDKNVWQNLPPMPVTVNYAGIVVSNGYLWAVGGEDTEFLDVVQRFDLLSKKWERTKPLERALIRPLVVECCGKPYAIGPGRITRHGMDCLVIRYDTETDCWKEITKVPSPRRGASICSLDGCIYVIGGSYFDENCLLSLASDIVEQLEVTTGVWSTMPSLNMPRVSAGIAVFQGSIYVLGGIGKLDPLTTLDSVESWKPGESQWKMEARLPRPLAQVACGVLTISVEALTWGN